MSADIRKKLKSALVKAQKQKTPVSPAEMRRAVYDAFVAKYGIEAVGDWSLYELKPNGYWTEERLMADALRFNTRTEWKNYSQSAYQPARRLGKEFLNRCCAHMKVSLTEAYTEDELLANAKRFNTRTEWAVGSTGTYQKALKRGMEFFERCCAHMKAPQNKPYTDDELIADAKRFNARGEWSAASHGACKAAKKRGNEFYERCCAHMKAPQRPHTDDELLADAKRFNTRKEWELGSSGAHKAAYTRDKEFYERCCSHMPKRAQRKKKI